MRQLILITLLILFTGLANADGGRANTCDGILPKPSPAMQVARSCYLGSMSHSNIGGQPGASEGDVIYEVTSDSGANQCYMVFYAMDKTSGSVTLLRDNPTGALRSYNYS